MSQILSTNEKNTERVLQALRNLDAVAANQESIASGIRDHGESWYAKPSFRTYAEGAEIFTMAADEEKQVSPFSRTFNYRPWDVALAVHRVAQKVFGHPCFAEPGRSQTISLPVDHGKTVEVVYGFCRLPELKAEVMFDDTRDRRLGVLGVVTMVAPKKLHNEIRGFLKLVDDDLAVNSIYKGKAITSETMPKFLNPYSTKRDEIVWSASVDAALRGSLFNPIIYTERCRARGIKLHRSVLFYGEPGNGKSETINVTAQIAIENGWTYVMATTTLREALQTARLLAPAVIAAEDFERLIREASDEERNELLEEMDGTTSKGQEIMLVTTTNFIEDLDKASRRRMFKEIEFGPLDVAGIENFLKIRLKGQLADDCDLGAVARALDGWGNSYIAKVQDFASSLALEHLEPKLTTQDLLDAVEAQRPDWEGYQTSKKRPEPNRFDEAFIDIVVRALERDREEV